MQKWSHLWFCFLFLGCSIVTIAQEKQIDVKIEYRAVNTQLKEVFKDLEEKYNIRFSYSTESILEKKTSCDFQDLELGEVLDYLLEDDALEYKIIGNNVLLRKQDDYVDNNDDRYKQSLHIKGRVVFEDTQEKLEFASISINNSSIGTFTDSEGNFDLEIPAEYLNDSLVIHYLGLEDQVFLISDLEGEYILVPLSLGPVAVDEVVIVNRKKKIRILDKENAITVQLRNDAQSGILGADLSRNLQKLAGVSASDDSSAEIKIRGSHSDETLIILDEMPIYNCTHYYGVFNSINTNFVEEIQLYKSFFPFEYGGKTGGIVKLSSDKQKVENSYVDFEIDLMTVGTKARLQFNEDLSLTLAGRGTTRNISNTQFNSFGNDVLSENTDVQSFSESIENTRSNPSFRFYDFNSRLRWDISDTQSLSFNIFGSSDAYQNGFNRTIKENDSSKELRLDASEEERWINLASSIQHDLVLKNKYRISTVGIFSNYYSDGNVDYTVRKPPKNQGDSSTDILIGLDQDNLLRDIGVKSSISIPIASHSLKVGTEIINHTVSYQFKDNDDFKLRNDHQVNDISFFAQDDIALFKNVSLNTGLRSTYFQGTGKMHHSPRALLSYKIGESLKLKSSYGIYQQFIREFPFEYRGTPKKLWVAVGENGIPVLESNNWMIGVSKIFTHLGVDVELYYKDFKGLTEFIILEPGKGNNDDGPGQRDYNLFIGDGFSRGIDIMLNSGYKNYETYLSYTLSESKERYDEIGNNQYYSAEDDRRHQAKWINSIKWKPFNVGLDYIYLSGRRYTNLRNLGSSGSVANSNSKDRFQRINPYNRFDISVGYDFTFFHHSSRISFSVLNVLNNENNKYVQNVSEDVSQDSESINVIVGNESALLGRTLNISWKVQLGKW